MNINTSQALIKADLIVNQQIYISKDIQLTHPLERSTTGPGANTPAIVLNYDNTYVKMQVSRNSNEIYSLQKTKTKGKYNLLKNNSVLLDNITIVPNAFHAPGQIFLNLENRCIYNCGFCNPSTHNFLQKYSKNDFVELINKALSKTSYSSVSLTSGIFPNNEKIIDMMSYIISEIKKNYPSMPIGVEPCIFTLNEIETLKRAGADEIKINLQLPEKKLFEKICPDFDYNKTVQCIERAVQLFGRNKVSSNILFGFGESTQSIINAVDFLASKGVVPTLRKIRINSENKNKIQQKLNYTLPQITSDYLINLGLNHKKILEKYNLTTKSYKTMCHACGCCDIVPFWDL